MLPALSTQVLFPQRLTPSLLDALAGSGAQAIEIFCGRHHFDYTDRSQVREIARWFASSPATPTLHAPVSAESWFSRHAAPTLDLVASDKGRRIDAMDEVKRALEVAEQIPAPTCVLHLGLADSRWSEPVEEFALRAIEHLKAFAAPLGMRLLLENLPNQVATPEHLLHLLSAGHFSTCGLCLDVAHAHLTDDGIEKTVELLRVRIGEVHLSDNLGLLPGAQPAPDAHLWPASGTERPSTLGRGSIDWAAIYPLLETLPASTPGVLEIADTEAASPEFAGRTAREVYAHQARLLELVSSPAQR